MLVHFLGSIGFQELVYLRTYESEHKTSKCLVSTLWKDFNLNVVKFYKYVLIVILALFKISRNMDRKVLKYVWFTLWLYFSF